MKLDACEVCCGILGGTPGNENIIRLELGEVVMCDYCHALYLDGDLKDYKNPSNVIVALRLKWAEISQKHRAKGDQ